jgi:4a-hydroxytetrahydrobiopterin dehydratase
MANTEKVYSDDEIQQRLVGPLQHWYLEDGWLRRKYRTEGWKGTLMVVNAVGHLAEAAWHHPDLTVSYAFVIVKLKTHSAKGITDKDFTLAEKMESFIQWQPRLEGGALEGTPTDDQRFRYIKYDAPKPAQAVERGTRQRCHASCAATVTLCPCGGAKRGTSRPGKAAPFSPCLRRKARGEPRAQPCRRPPHSPGTASA